jgi:peroxiredoxin
MMDAIRELLAGPGTTQEKLAKIRSLRDSFVLPEYTIVMDRAIDDLIKSEIRASALKTGESIPEFELRDTRGKPVSTRTLLARGPVVISFYRGSWCPYCTVELHGLQKALPEIEALGASIIAVSPELPERQIETRDSNKLAFPILNDVGNQVAKLFGIVYDLPADLLVVYRALGHDLADMNGTLGATELPLPATFVVDPTGKIRLAYIDEDYAKRLSPDDILAALRVLNG